MKSILLSIKSEFLVKLLNCDSSILIRKKFPKDYVGWVYLYCSKGKPYLYGDKSVYEGKQEYFWVQKIEGNGIVPLLNGKVVARFWCDNVEEINTDVSPDSHPNFYKESCLYPSQLFDYIGHSKWYIVNISKLEIFDKPRELKYFHYRKLFHRSEPDEEGRKTFKALIQLDKAPQNLCYIEEGID